MLCEKCGIKQAMVHCSQVINGEKTEYNLCQDCAKEAGLLNEFNFDFGNLFAEFFHPTSMGTGKKEVLECPNCHTDLSTFEKLGKLGCADCYDTFGSQISPLLKRIHGSSAHTGKLPKEVQGELKAARKIDSLKAKLEQAIKEEAFEEAAKLRDEIREMEGLK